MVRLVVLVGRRCRWSPCYICSSGGREEGRQAEAGLCSISYAVGGKKEKKAAASYAVPCPCVFMCCVCVLRVGMWFGRGIERECRYSPSASSFFVFLLKPLSCDTVLYTHTFTMPTTGLSRCRRRPPPCRHGVPLLHQAVCHPKGMFESREARKGGVGRSVGARGGVDFHSSSPTTPPSTQAQSMYAFGHNPWPSISWRIARFYKPVPEPRPP